MQRQRIVRAIGSAKTTAPVSHYAVEGLTSALARNGVRVVAPEHRLVTALGRRLGKVGLARRYASVPPSYVRPLMGPADALCFPRGLTHELIPYCFDCVPPNYADWRRLFGRYEISLAFFSAKRAADDMNRTLPQIVTYWVPEAVDPSAYSRGECLANRSTHILELGRRWSWYHEIVSSAVEGKPWVHLFEPEPGTLVFPTRAALRKGLADSMISICIPSNITHPERFGATETATHRYFESIASRCVVVGICPEELKTLFGYSPVIELDFERPEEQIVEILTDIGRYQELVDANYSRLLEVGTWDHRARRILSALETRGYAPG